MSNQNQVDTVTAKASEEYKYHRYSVQSIWSTDHAKKIIPPRMMRLTKSARLARRSQRLMPAIVEMLTIPPLSCSCWGC